MCQRSTPVSNMFHSVVGQTRVPTFALETSMLFAISVFFVSPTIDLFPEEGGRNHSCGRSGGGKNGTNIRTL
ncbi:hypothetical protein B6V73_15885 [Thioclava sp. JM3]|nr:hypothetical protein B6V73_15885 [Thioclava sp. JM3]